jgi:hypothetical protein
MVEGSPFALNCQPPYVQMSCGGRLFCVKPGSVCCGLQANKRNGVAPPRHSNWSLLEPTPAKLSCPVCSNLC